MKYSFISALVALTSTVDATTKLDPIDIVGNKFFYHTNGSQFYMRGVAYQSNSLTNQSSSTTFNDPLADSESCKRDIPLLQKLSTNVIRTYALNASLNHDDCMNMLADAGIYVITDLSEPGVSINRDDPQWNTELLTRYTSVVDAMANYSNVLGFFAGNEVVNAKNNTDAAPFVKAAIRDTKAYIKQKGYRSIPVGYSASDDADVRIPEANYFACGDKSESADFYGVNMYEWCGESDFKTSGYQARTEEMKNMSIPLFFSEYGCNAVKPRKFQEVGTLYSSDMTDVWSGGIVYMFFQEDNDYGLVSVSNGQATTLDDFNYLSSALATISPTIGHSSDQTQSTSTIACPATSQVNWAAATSLPPQPNADACDCISDSAACQVGSSVDEDNYGSIFGYICGASSKLCNAILKNGTTGEYGAFAGCSPKQQLNYVLNAYYNANGKSSSACDFKGQASLQKSASTGSSCAALLSSVGTAGTASLSQGSTLNVGSSTATAKATSGSSSKSGSSSDSASGSASSSSSSSSKSKNGAATNGNIGVMAGVLGGFFAVLFNVL